MLMMKTPWLSQGKRFLIGQSMKQALEHAIQ